MKVTKFINYFLTYKKYIYFILLWILFYSFLYKWDYKNIKYIDKSTLKEPLQVEIISPKNIYHKWNKINYDIVPLYDYEISWLVVSKIDQDNFNFENTDLLSTDLCILYWDILKNDIFRNKQLKFWSSWRVCWRNGPTNVISKFSSKEVTNNHIVVNSKIIKDKLHQINIGDQVFIKWKLVNLDLKPNTENSNIQNYSLKSSTTRLDSWLWACEIIFIEDFKIIVKWHPILSLLYFFSLRILISVLIVDFILLFSDYWLKKQTKINNYENYLK